MLDIYYCAAHGDIESVRSFLDNGADVNALDEPGGTPVLQLAAQEGYLDIVRLLVARGADVHALNGYGETPLHETAVHNQPKVAEFLLYCGADLHQEFDGDTLLHVAARHDSLEVASLYIDRGIPVDALDEGERTPLQCAAEWGARDTAEMLIGRGSKIDMTVAAGLCDEEMMRSLLALGADIKGSEELPLDTMVRCRRQDSVEFLLSFGADPNVRDSYGCTPLFHAIGCGNMSIPRMLISHGADVRAMMRDHRTPLHFASDYDGHDEFAALLISNGADVNAQDDSGWTPLHVSANRDAGLIGELLLLAGADPYIVDIDGKTPLLLAKERESFDILKVLRNAGVTR